MKVTTVYLRTTCERRDLMVRTRGADPDGILDFSVPFPGAAEERRGDEPHATKVFKSLQRFCRFCTHRLEVTTADDVRKSFNNGLNMQAVEPTRREGPDINPVTPRTQPPHQPDLVTSLPSSAPGQRRSALKGCQSSRQLAEGGTRCVNSADTCAHKQMECGGVTGAISNQFVWTNN